jgi:hypothetical protein
MVYNHPKCKGEKLKFEHLDHFKNHVEDSRRQIEGLNVFTLDFNFHFGLNAIC